MSPLLEKVDEYSPSSIQKFYSGTGVFITGGTGFLGRLLLEKLLRSCPDISTVYVLVRGKKDKAAHERIDELLDDVVFERLKEEYPNFRHKVIPVDGDCALPGLGICEQDRKILTSEVSVVFHVAATVNFNKGLKLATFINVRGTRDLLRLCKDMVRLKSVVHVSTAFSHCIRQVVAEEFYPAPIEPEKIIALCETLDEQMLQDITLKILDKFPNTYTFTKAIAENMIEIEGKTLPAAVFRPSLVISTFKEPIRGWMNNLYGPTGTTVVAFTGLSRSMHCDPEANSNVVPADMCVNALISVAWDVGAASGMTKSEGRQQDVPIYHFESSTDRPINWGDYMKFASINIKLYPTISAIWYYSFALRKQAVSHFLAALFLHYLPALLVDTALFCVCKKPRFTNMYRKIDKVTNVVSWFTTRNFCFRSTRLNEMIVRMSAKDQNIFFCDLKKLDWQEFFRTYIKGTRVYLLKDPLSTLEEARKKWKRLYWLHQGCKVLLAFIVFKLFWSMVSYVFYI